MRFITSYEHTCTLCTVLTSAKRGGVMRQAIVSHPEHDVVYVKDPACRSFSYKTLQTFIQIVVENMPAGAAPSHFPPLPPSRGYTAHCMPPDTVQAAQQACILQSM